MSTKDGIQTPRIQCKMHLPKRCKQPAKPYNFALGHWSIRSFISNRGQSGFNEGEGLSRSHAHFSL